MPVIGFRGIVGELLGWAEREGVPTPSLLLSRAVLGAGVAELRDRLGGRVSYATKANAHPLVLRELAPLVDEFNVTNLAHLDDLLGLGVEPSRISFLHPVPAPETVAAAAARGVSRFVADDSRGLGLLRGLGRPVRVTLRLLPPDPGESPRSVIRFGNTGDVIRRLAGEVVASGMELEALSFFVGTAGAGLAEALPYRRGIEALARLYERLVEDGIPAPALNIGGGFPGSRQCFHLRHPDFFARIREALIAHFGSGLDFVSEPGRFLCEPAMAMLTRVIADRSLAGRRLVYVDASAYGGLFEHCFVEPGGADVTIEPAGAAPALVLGPVMDSFDVIKREASLPPPGEGELLLLPNTGAYSWGYTTRCEGLEPPAVHTIPAHLDPEFANTWFD